MIKLGCVATDLIGNPRVFGGEPDIGCYENQTVGPTQNITTH